MLDITEKAVWILTVLALLATGAWFFLIGPPSTRPWIATRSEEVNKRQFESTLSAEGQKRIKEIQSESTKPKDGKRPRRRDEKHRAINAPMFDKISNRTDALKEAKKASSELKTNKDGTVVLVINEFGDDNLFERLGFEENDEIEAVHGLPLDISELDAWRAFDDLKSRFQQGEAIYVDLKRKGKPIRMWFGPDETWPTLKGE